jgi:hypothetical protein
MTNFLVLLQDSTDFCQASASGSCPRFDCNSHYVSIHALRRQCPVLAMREKAACCLYDLDRATQARRPLNRTKDLQELL